MGLLDQVLGQVIGRMGGGQPQMQQPGGYPQGGGFGAPGGAAGLPGGLGQILGGNGGKIALAILALLASKHLNTGAGGYGSVLHDMFAGNRSGGSAGAPSSGGMFDQGSESSSAAPNSGGFLNEIGGMLGGGNQSAADNGFGNMGGGLGGGLGGMLGGGLGELLNRFSQNGHGDAMQSWIGTGPNQSVSPQQLETSLGSDTVDSLSRETGLERGDLLSQLSQALPQVVDKLTPNGRLPESHETSTWV